LIREYGIEKFDLFSIGLIWLVFLKTDVMKKINKNLTLDEVKVVA